MKLRIHGGCIDIRGRPARVVPRAPAPAREYGAPGFFALQGRFTHPIIGSDVDQIQVRKLLGKIIESHPEFSLVPDANAEEFFVAVREGIPFPGTFAPGTVPFAFTPGITKSD